MVATEGGRQPPTVTHRLSLAARVGGAEGVGVWRSCSVSRSSDTAPTRKGKVAL
jgi:hypothetical protein